MMMSSEEIAENETHTLKRSEPTEDATLISSSHSGESTHLLLTRGKFITHHPKAGLNPLVDTAAYLFSIIGRLKQIKSYRHLAKLHKELVAEINTFQDTIKSQGYNSEHILVSRYALCATLDDVIMNTTWGSQGQWDTYSMLTTFNKDSNQRDRFFIILERLIKDPNLYIELMEFMYVCLTLGFKGSYRSTEFSHNQFEQICNALYKHIHAHHGDFSRSLSPFVAKHIPVFRQPTKPKKPAIVFTLLITACIILSIFIGLRLLLDTLSNQTYQELLHIGKSLIYETHDT